MGEVICPFCKASLQESAIIRCLRCGTGHHNICWLENAGHCSVFSCGGQQVRARKKYESNILLAIWCLMNYALHLSLRFIGRWTTELPVEDIVIVAILESSVLATGWMVMKARSASESVRTIGLLLFQEMLCS